MARDVFVHLLEPTVWRAALTDGAVRPPSLDSVGFVHLSRPEQVHLPAGYLVPGRRDLVLLVVDPARLTDPVRWEPGDPDDPESMRFPHLYGPLPVTAVVAVVPYRPPVQPTLPDPDDALARALAYYASLPIRRAVGVGDVAGGVAVLDPDFPHSRDNNELVLTSPVDADTVAAAAEEVAGNAGWPSVSASLLWPGSGQVAAKLRELGWRTEELLVMARSPEDDADRAGVDVVAQSEVHEFWARSWRRGLAGLGPRLDRVVAELVGREQLNDRVLAVTDLVVREQGRVVASGQLRIDGATAAVDSVLTDTDARGRGFANAVLTRALARAAAAGCDLVVLQAAAHDWPHAWYARRGFATVGSTWSVYRPA